MEGQGFSKVDVIPPRKSRQLAIALSAASLPAGPTPARVYRSRSLPRAASAWCGRCGARRELPTAGALREWPPAGALWVRPPAGALREWPPAGAGATRTKGSNVRLTLVRSVRTGVRIALQDFRIALQGVRIALTGVRPTQPAPGVPYRRPGLLCRVQARMEDPAWPPNATGSREQGTHRVERRSVTGARMLPRNSGPANSARDTGAPRRADA